MFRNRVPKSRVLLEGRVPRPWLIGVLAALGVVVIVAVLGLSVAYTDSCSACHIIDREVATYEQSAHYRAGVSCQQCHTKPGVFNYLIRNLQGATNIILYVSNS
jgi:nitrate/TMAO reductase-like tetraheme cytochrome c subunit